MAERYRISDLEFHTGKRGTSARHAPSVHLKEGPQVIEHIDIQSAQAPSVSAQSELSGHSGIQTAAHRENTAAPPDSNPSLPVYTGQGPSVLTDYGENSQDFQDISQENPLISKDCYVSQTATSFRHPERLVFLMVTFCSTGPSFSHLNMV